MSTIRRSLARWRERRACRWQERPPPTRRQQVRSLAWTIGLCLLFRALVAEAFYIPSESMVPTLEIGDRVVASKLTYGLRLPLLGAKLVDGRLPRRGEIVLFDHPRESKVLIKRVVAVGGDTVALRENQLVINGRAVPRTALAEPCAEVFDPSRGPEPCAAFRERHGGQCYRVLQRLARQPTDFGPVTVPAGEVFVMGDSRDNSDDSRYWGTVPYANLKGRALALLWSWGPRGPRWGRSFRGLGSPCPGD